VLGLVGAVAAGIGLWRFTGGDWLSGLVCAVAVLVVAVVYVAGQRRLQGRDRGRRYE
jgi:membrane protein YdbS with pleckstrin-like domain